MNSEIKHKLKEKTKIYKKYVKKNYDIGYKQLLNEKMIETSNLIANAKRNYNKKFTRLLIGSKKILANPKQFLDKQENAHNSSIV